MEIRRVRWVPGLRFTIVMAEQLDTLVWMADKALRFRAEAARLLCDAGALEQRIARESAASIELARKQRERIISPCLPWFDAAAFHHAQTQATARRQPDSGSARAQGYGHQGAPT
jgi:hypothetical protein